MNYDTELLAPAGDWDAFVAAVENGADAVYMGGKLFNARQFAGNFDNEQLKRALDYAHVRGVKIYLTMNTLMSDSELKEAVDFTGEAYKMGMDGIIVQDLGFAGLIRSIYPDLDLHASTQMTVYNLEGVKVLERLGFKRAVLARELSIEEMTQITRNTPLEIEVFVHGALCISYSGQCLMSSIIGGRSGNRGKCAQPCRLPYELIGKKVEVKAEVKEGQKDLGFTSYGKGYLMSPKDLSSIEELTGIIKSGVKSFKIEGRMKSPEYVATVVRIYRKYLDEIMSTLESKEINKLRVDTADVRDLTQIFNRGGFSTAYLVNKTGRDMMSYEKPKNWGIYLGEVISYDRASRTCKIKLQEDLSIGDGIEVWNNEEGESPGTVVSEIKVNSKGTGVAKKGDTVQVGSLNGKINKGNKVYKTSDKRLLDAARETYTGKGKRKTLLWGKVIIRQGSPIEFSVRDQARNEAQLKGEALTEPAINKPLTEERLLDQLNKTGGTPFEFAGVEVQLESGLSLPVSEINNIRRRALEEMESRIAGLYERSMSKEIMETKENLLNFPGNSRNRAEDLKLSVLFYSVDRGFDYSSLPVDRVYLPFNAFLTDSGKSLLQRFEDREYELFVWLPPITRGNYDSLIRSRLATISESGIDGILIGNLGSIEHVRNSVKGLKVMGDYSLNTFNSFTADELHKLELDGATLSMELNLAQIGDLRHNRDMLKEAVVYGKIPLMTSEYCPVGSTAGGFTAASACNKACMRGEYRLRDRKGMEFPVLCDRIDCRSVILNPNVIFVPDSLDKIRNAGVSMVRINITDEEPDEVHDIVNIHRAVIEDGYKALDRYNDLIDKIKGKGFTKGHYYRGV